MTQAMRNALPVSIAVVDSGGVLLAMSRLDGAFPATAELAMQKARTAASFREDTSWLQAHSEKRPALLSAPFVLMGGGVPLFVGWDCVGAVGVSGVTPEQDIQIAKAAKDALKASLP